MNSLKKTFGATLLLLTAFIALSSDVKTFAQGSTGSPPQIPDSPRSDAPRPNATPPTGLPATVNNPQALQQILAALEFQTKRADAAEARSAEWQRQADEWKGLYSSEKERADLLKQATGERRDAQAQTAFAVQLLRDQHADDKLEIARQNDRIRSLERSRFKWAVGGFVLGGGTCAAATIPNVFR